MNADVVIVGAGPAGIQKIGAFAPYKRFAQQNLGGGRIHFARAF